MEQHTPRHRPSGQYAAADSRRAAIIDAALLFFAKAGYLNSSLAKIAEEAGTSATVITHHFGSKQRLLMAVLEAREDRTVRTFGRLGPDSGGDSGDDVRALFREVLALAAYNLTQPGLIQLYTKLSAEAGDPAHPAHTYFAERYERVARHLASALQRSVDRGQLRAGIDPESIAREILAVSDGLQVQWAVTDGRLDFVGLYRTHLDRLTRALTVDGKGLDEPAGEEQCP
ncbi:TetR family transcriptional regulator [Streptomyces longisporoflavus]|uniref:TetR/AcrR family transcriptional regulator n=1 Tax=Streptomyces longisporoflavus TaxID=28044 RepID=UPI00167E0306|nr:TetR/AcrR family transcriptional regulator [Streptomyces longisporoflavus]GGV34668.1 TetR family transcriptional regulator [Streptomyces longisporoflavus]